MPSDRGDPAAACPGAGAAPGPVRKEEGGGPERIEAARAGASRRLSSPRGRPLQARPPTVGTTGNCLAAAATVRASEPGGAPRALPNSAAETPGQLRAGLRAGDPFPGPARRGGGKTRQWPPASPSSPPLRGRRAPAPPLVAEARLGSPRLGLELRADSLGSRPVSRPGSGAAGGGPPALYPPADAVPARAVRQPPSCQSCGHEKREPRRRALTAPLGRRRPGRTKAVHRGRRLLLSLGRTATRVPSLPDTCGGRSSRPKANADDAGAGGVDSGWLAAGPVSPAPWMRPGRGRHLVPKHHRNPRARSLSLCRHDHPCTLLHLRQDRRQQVGGLPGVATSRVHRGGRPGCPGPEALLLPANAAGPRGPDREAAQLCAPGEVSERPRHQCPAQHPCH